MSVPARFAAAVSEHPRTSHAIGEVVGQVAESLVARPDVAVLFATPQHAAELLPALDVVARVLDAPVTLAACASGVLGGSREVEDAPGVSLWAGCTGAARAVRIEPGRRPPDELAGATGTLVTVADPFSVDPDALLGDLVSVAPGLEVVGGLASAARQPGQNVLFAGGDVHRDGAVAVWFGPDVALRAVVSQGGRPVGDPMIVTAADGPVVRELAGRPALARLRELVERADEAERALLARGVLAGIVIDERKLDFGRGDFVVRELRGADHVRGSLVLGDEGPVGATVQFHVRDAASADDDLRALVGAAPAHGALVFTCTARGRHLFAEPDHDASIVHEAVRPGGVAGMFCAGELGPVGGRNHLHTHTASVALFG